MPAVNSAAPASAIASPWAGAAIVQATMDPGVGTEWPGAITSDHGQDDGWQDHSAVPPNVAGGRGSPPTPPGANPIAEQHVLGEVPGSGYVPSGVAWLDHDVATEVWDSNAGNVHGAGAIAPIHEIGKGSSPKFFETPQDIGNPLDLYIPNQSYAPEWSWDTTTGNRENLATQWVAHDQVPDVNGSGYDYRPRFYDYEINVVSPNLAEVAQPTNDVGQYGVMGATSDYSNTFDDQSVLYSPPADPQVIQAPTNTAPYGTGEGEVW